MIQYKYNDNMFFSYDNHHIPLAYLEYTLPKSQTLYIKNIEVPTNTKLLYPRNHHGTELFNHFLLHIQNSGITFGNIKGLLSWADAERGNWLKSIPFYADFPLYKYSELQYNLVFHFYDDADCTNEVSLPSDFRERLYFIESFCQKHLHSHSCASFAYTLR